MQVARADDVAPKAVLRLLRDFAAKTPVSVKNTGQVPIHLNPEFNVEYEAVDGQNKVSREVPSAPELQIYIVLPLQGQVATFGLNGQGPAPVEILPGRTRKFDAYLDENAIAFLKEKTSMTIQLRLLDQVISSQNFKRSNGLWKAVRLRK